jgi:hypothetical protein
VCSEHAAAVVSVRVPQGMDVCWGLCSSSPVVGSRGASVCWVHSRLCAGCFCGCTLHCLGLCVAANLKVCACPCEQ